MSRVKLNELPVTAGNLDRKKIVVTCDDGPDARVPATSIYDEWVAPLAAALGTLTEKQNTADEVARQKSVYVTPEMYGARGDGQTDDTQAFVRANAALALGGEMILMPNKIYQVHSTLNLSNVSSLRGNGSTLRKPLSSYSGNAYLLRFGNPLGAVTLSSLIDVQPGQTDIPAMPELAHVRAGDVLTLSSTDVRLANPVGNYYHGQIAAVVGVTNGRIRLSTPFYDTFQISSISVNRCPRTFRLEDLVVDVSETPSTVALVQGIIGTINNANISGVTIVGNDFVSTGFNINGEQITFNDVNVYGAMCAQGYDPSATTPRRLGYGINVAGNEIKVVGGNVQHAKHCVAAASRNVVSRGLVYDGVNVVGKLGENGLGGSAAALDFHANVHGMVQVLRCKVFNYGPAVTMRSGNAFMDGNEIHLFGNEATPAFSFAETPVKMTTLSNNKVYLQDNHCLVDPYEASVIENLKIVSNEVRGGHFVRTSASTLKNFGGIHSEGNTLRDMAGYIGITLKDGGVLDGLRLNDDVVVTKGSSLVRLTTASGSTANCFFNNVTIGGRLSIADRPAGERSGITFSGSSFKNLVIDDVDINVTSGAPSGTEVGVAVLNSNIESGTFRRIRGNEQFRFFASANVVYKKVVVEKCETHRIQFISNSPSTRWEFDVSIKDCDINFDVAFQSAVVFAMRETTIQERPTSVIGNRITSAGSIGVQNTASNHRVLYSGNVTNKPFNDATGAYTVPIVGNVCPVPQPYKGGTVATSGGTVAHTSAPTSGEWVVGDRVLNSNPSTGQPTGWVCTASGTPGTWAVESILP